MSKIVSIFRVKKRQNLSKKNHWGEITYINNDNMPWVTGLYSKSMLGTHDLSRCCMFCCFISIYQFTYNESGCNLSWAPWFNYWIRQSSFQNLTTEFCLGSTFKFYHDSDAMVFFVANFCISVTSYIKLTVFIFLLLVWLLINLFDHWIQIWSQSPSSYVWTKR